MLNCDNWFHAVFIRKSLCTKKKDFRETEKKKKIEKYNKKCSHWN